MALAFELALKNSESANMALAAFNGLAEDRNQVEKFGLVQGVNLSPCTTFMTFRGLS